MIKKTFNLTPSDINELNQLVQKLVSLTINDGEPRTIWLSKIILKQDKIKLTFWNSFMEECITILPNTKAILSIEENQHPLKRRSLKQS